MAAVTLGSKAVGDIVKIKIGGVLEDFIIVHKGKPSSMYDASCDGVWVLKKVLTYYGKWSSIWADYENSYLHSDFKDANFLDDGMRRLVKTVRIPYAKGYGVDQTVASGANGLSCKAFALSLYEVGGFQGSNNNREVVDGSVLAYFSGLTNAASNKRKAECTYSQATSGTKTGWVLRTPPYHSGNVVNLVYPSGFINTTETDKETGRRYAMIFPTNLMVDDSGEILSNTAPTMPSSISVPSTINGGSTITISWGASSDVESNLEGYKLERSTNGGSTWSQIYQGGARSTTNTVAFGTSSVMYRVKAYDSEGLESGWRTSQSVTVINNHAPTAPGSISVPLMVNGGKPLAVSWTAATDSDGNLSGYVLERQNNGGTWTELYRGTALTYTDSVPKGIQTVAYRVRAYDTLSAYGAYTTSETRTVNNNTAPVISCQLSGNLGVKSEGFTIPYSVSDEDGDPITVTEKVDSEVLQSFQADSGTEHTFALTDEAFMRVLNGQRNLSIIASDGKEQSTHKLTFSKSVTEASVTLAEPLPADAPITICALSVSGSIPADAVYTVEVTNNALGDEPVWEDCTAAVKTGANVVFAHQADSGHAFNFRLSVRRGPSGQGGYIASIQGGFQ